MSAMHHFAIELKTEAQTKALGASLAAAAGPGDVIALLGTLGAGKTTLARGLIQAFTGESQAPSPTFTLVETYDGPRGALWHFDLYRLHRADEVWEAGLEEAFERALTLVEWPELIEAALPEDTLIVRLEIADNKTRRALIDAPERWIAPLRAAGIA